jgi:hypothetical protein
LQRFAPQYAHASMCSRQRLNATTPKRQTLNEYIAPPRPTVGRGSQLRPYFPLLRRASGGAIVPRPRNDGGCLSGMTLTRTIEEVPLLDDIDATVIVTVVAVGVMQVAFDEIIDVITVRNCFVPATGAVFMAGRMTSTVMIRRTPIGIL